MRKILCSITLCLGIATASVNSYAQEAGIGFKAGVDFNNMSGLHINNDFKAYFYGGAQAYLNFGKLGLQVEGLLTQTQLSTGENFKAAFNDFINTTGQAVEYGELLLTELAFPAMLTYEISRPVRIEAGVQYSSIINATDKHEYFKKPEEIIKNSYLSALVGLRLQIGGTLQLGARYIQGIDDMNATEVDERWKTGRFQLGVAVNLFRL